MSRARGDAAPTLLDVREAAEFLRLGPRKVYDLVAKGEVPHTRAGAKILFERAALERWLAGRASGAGAERAAPATIAGSHDPLLEWAVRESRSGLALLTQGSEDGLERLLAGEACAALVHVPTPDLAGFNTHLAERKLRGRNVVLLEWARREQGLLVVRGNPLHLKDLGELRARRARVALRQPGSGSRELFERLLEREGVRRAQLRFAPGEAMSENDLAAAIRLGEADAGLGARAAAHLAGLDFIALFTERVDLAVLRPAWFDPPLRRLAEFARTRRFAEHARALGGYDIARFGETVWNG